MAMGTGGPLRQPIPTARSIPWSPAGEGSSRPGDVPFPVFLSQTALSAIHEHVAAPARPGQGVLGFLLGDLCECPETNVSYLVIDAAVRLSLALYSDRTRDIVTRLWDRVQAQLEEQKAYLIGWYHTHPPLPLTITQYDVETHEQYFGEPWQVALLLGTDPAEPSGAFFRASSDEAWVNTPLPFYELLNPDSIRPDGRKRSFVTWRNYHAHGAATTSGRSGPHAAVAPPPAAPRPAEPKFTPAAAKPKPPPSPSPSEPPPPRAPEREPVDTGELKFLTAAEDMPPPLPPRRPTPPPRAAFPAAPPPPPPRPAPLRSEPELEEGSEPQAPTDLGADAAAPVWPDEFERTDDTALEQPAEFEEAPRAARRRRRRLPRKVWVTLFLLLVGAAGAGAFWWFQPALPSLPDWSTVTSKWSTLTTKVSALATKVWALKGKVWPRHQATAPRKTPPKPAPKPKPTPPPAPTAAAPVRAPVRAAIDIAADSLTQSVRDFGERAALFTRGQLPCGGLGRSLSSVESRWLAYNAARRSAGVLDAAHAARDQTLYAGVDSVERRFDLSGCPRP